MPTPRDTQIAAALAGAGLSVPKPVGTVSGDLLVAWVVQGGSAAGTAAGIAITGFTARGAGADNTGFGSAMLLSKAAGGSEPANYTVTYNGTDAVVILTCLATGTFDATTPFPAGAVTYAFDTASSATKTAPSTTGVNGALLLAGYGSVGTTTSSITFSGLSGSQTDLAQTDAGATGHVAADLASLALAATGATATLTDTASASRRSVTVAASVSPGGPQTITQTPSDNLGLTDAIKQGLGRAPSDNLGLTDSLSGALGRNPSDSLGLTDSLSQVSSLGRVINDSLRLTDSLVAQYIRQDIQDYNFVLADSVSDSPWVPFGVGQAIDLKAFDPGGFDVRNQDTPGVQGDYMTFGTDYHTPPVWSWDLRTDMRTPGDARDWADRFKVVWQNAVRNSPNGVVPMRYRIDGVVRRVWGRPRRFTPSMGKIHLGKIYIVADFQLAEDVYYDDVESGTIVAIAPGWTGSSGIILPSTLPWQFSTGPAPRLGQMQIQGTTNTWVDAVFTGPISNPWVQVGSLTFGLVGFIPLGKNVRLSGKPWQMGVYMSDGSWHPEMLDPRSRLSQLQMAPGLYAITYGGADATGTSQVTVTWRNAYTSP